MSVVFLDTVGLLALWDKSDQWHISASAAFTKIVASRSRLVTTGYVFLECGNAASRKTFRPAVDRLRREIRTKGQLFDPTDVAKAHAGEMRTYELRLMDSQQLWSFSKENSRFLSVILLLRTRAGTSFESRHFFACHRTRLHGSVKYLNYSQPYASHLSDGVR